ncbi:hypothetical protein ZOSMA_968G00020 [Zostera marina]|uniref:Nucleoporin Nup133/Nup155-like N-terminal domain-containing protein n=1 Tax=Zostera marina TaxID=29655 RepID=A0A0K9NKA6_ZOSMR|nr:hypothetical protein ZOSMA_968G00020 [Zostera marina]
MFTPAIRKSRPVFSKDKNRDHGPSDSQSTPAPDPFAPDSSNGHGRPATGTSAPWNSRLSVLARITPTKNEENAFNTDLVQPTYIGEIPEIVRTAQTNCLQKTRTGIRKNFYGGMDRATSMAWMICQEHIFIWSYFDPSFARKCVLLQLPSSVLALIHIDSTVRCDYRNPWLVSLIKLKMKTFIGLVICHRKYQSIIYWPDIFTEDAHAPILWQPQNEEKYSITDGFLINSTISSSIPSSSYEVASLACHSNGHLWSFHCTPMSITQREVLIKSPEIDKKAHARSLTWRFQTFDLLGEEEIDSSSRQLFLLVDHEIQCWNIILQSPNHPKVTHLWSHEIVSTDG